MPRILPALACTPEQHERLTSLARGEKIQARLKERARIVLRGIDGVGIQDTAKEMGLDKDIVYLWQCRFLTAGVAGLQDRPRSGAPRKHGPELHERILVRLELAPPKGFGYWDASLLATTLGGGRVAGLGNSAHRRHLSGAQAFLVCQPGPRLCRQGDRRGGAVPVPTGKRHHVQCG